MMKDPEKRWGLTTLRHCQEGPAEGTVAQHMDLQGRGLADYKIRGPPWTGKATLASLLSHSYQPWLHLMFIYLTPDLKKSTSSSLFVACVPFTKLCDSSWGKRWGWTGHSCATALGWGAQCAQRGWRNDSSCWRRIGCGVLRIFYSSLFLF